MSVLLVPEIGPDTEMASAMFVSFRLWRVRDDHPEFEEQPDRFPVGNLATSVRIDWLRYQRLTTESRLLVMCLPNCRALAAQTEIFEKFSVLLNIASLYVIQHAASTPNHHQETSTTVVVLIVTL